MMDELALISEGALIGSDVVLGERIVVGAGARLIAPKHLVPAEESSLVIRDDVVIGPGALIAGAHSIGSGAQIAPGAVVRSDVPPHAIVEGNPARVVGYLTPAGTDRIASKPIEVTAPDEPGSFSILGGAAIYRFPEVADLRGVLAFAEINNHLPFEVQRFFCIYDVPSAEIRGEHAHRTLHELLICLSGTVRISLTDGRTRNDVVLSSPSIGLHLPPFVWSTQFQYSPGSVLMVLCSEPYDPASYIRDYDEYLALVQRL